MSSRSGCVVALVLAVLLGLSGCSTEQPVATGPRSVAPTPIEQLNTQALHLARVDFCDLVTSPAVRDALAGHRPSKRDAWRNGEPAQVGDDTSDVVHEYGCSWSRKGYSAQAWIFARPVSKAFGRTVLAKTARRPGCTTTAGPDFGTPGRRQVCTQPDGTRRDRLSGLFGDTWLTCETSGPADEPTHRLDARTDAWCVQIADATNTAR